MQNSSKCFLCRDLPVLTVNGRETEFVQNWTRECALSLLAILGMGSEEMNLQGILSEASFCVKCQETVCYAEFTLKTIAKLEREVERIRNDIKILLLGNDAHPTLLEGGSLEFNHSIPNVLTNIGPKPEPKEEEVNGLDEELEDNAAAVVPSITNKRLQKLRARLRHKSLNAVYSRSGRRITRRQAHPFDDDDAGEDSSPEYEPAEPSDLPQESGDDADVGKVKKVRKKNYKVQFPDRNSLRRNRQVHPTRVPPLEKSEKTLDILAVVAKLQAEMQQLEIVRPGTNQTPPAQPRKRIEVFVCSECQERFKGFAPYRRHLRRNHPQLYTEKLATGEMRPRKSLHPRPPPGQRTSCPKCSLSMRRDYLGAHLKHNRCKKETRIIKIHQCNICNYSSKIRRQYVNHVNTHSKQRSFSCALCPYASKTAGGLYTHRWRTHEAKESRFRQCTICGKFMKGGPTIMRNHVATVHGNSRPYLCALCGKAFKTKTTLRQHEPIHTTPHSRKKYGVQKKGTAGARVDKDPETFLPNSTS